MVFFFPNGNSFFKFINDVVHGFKTFMTMRRVDSHDETCLSRIDVSNAMNENNLVNGPLFFCLDVNALKFLNRHFFVAFVVDIRDLPTKMMIAHNTRKPEKRATTFIQSKLLCCLLERDWLFCDTYHISPPRSVE